VHIVLKNGTPLTLIVEDDCHTALDQDDGEVPFTYAIQMNGERPHFSEELNPEQRCDLCQLLGEFKDVVSDLP